MFTTGRRRRRGARAAGPGSRAGCRARSRRTNARPVVRVAVLDGVGAEGPAGVVHQHVQHRTDRLGQGRHGRPSVTSQAVATPPISSARASIRSVRRAAQWTQEALGRQPSGRSGADAAAGAGDEGDTTWHGHARDCAASRPPADWPVMPDVHTHQARREGSQLVRRGAQVLGILGGVAWVAAWYLWEGGDDPIELGLFWLGAALPHALPARARHAAGQARPARAAAVRRVRAAVAGLDGRRPSRPPRHPTTASSGGCRGCRGRAVRDRAARPGRRRNGRPSETAPSRWRESEIARRMLRRGWPLWRSPPTGRHARGVTRSRRDDQPAHLTARPAGDGRCRRHERLRDGALQAARAARHRGRHLHPRHVLGAADGARGGAGRAGPQHPRRPVRGADQGRAARPDVRVRPRGAARRGLPAAGPLLRAALPLLALRPGRGAGPRPLGRAARALDAHHGQGQERRARRGRHPRARRPDHRRGAGGRGRRHADRQHRHRGQAADQPVRRLRLARRRDPPGRRPRRVPSARPGRRTPPARPARGRVGADVRGSDPAAQGPRRAAARGRRAPRARARAAVPPGRPGRGRPVGLRARAPGVAGAARLGARPRRRGAVRAAGRPERAGRSGTPRPTWSPYRPTTSRSAWSPSRRRPPARRSWPRPWAA